MFHLYVKFTQVLWIKLTFLCPVYFATSCHQMELQPRDGCRKMLEFSFFPRPIICLFFSRLQKLFFTSDENEISSKCSWFVSTKLFSHNLLLNNVINGFRCLCLDSFWHFQLKVLKLHLIFELFLVLDGYSKCFSSFIQLRNLSPGTSLICNTATGAWKPVWCLLSCPPCHLCPPHWSAALWLYDSWGCYQTADKQRIT